MGRIFSLGQIRVIAPVSPLFVYLIFAINDTCESTMTTEFSKTE